MKTMKIWIQVSRKHNFYYRLAILINFRVSRRRNIERIHNDKLGFERVDNGKASLASGVGRW